MADGVNCYQPKALISLCRWSRNWSWPLKHLEFSQRARFVFLCEVDAFLLKVSLKRSVTLDIWHLTILLCPKLCILRRWRPLKRSAVKPAWMAPWWISSRLTVTWPHLHPLNKEGQVCFGQVLVENKRAHLLSRMIDIFEDRVYYLNCFAYLQCIFIEIVRCMMMLRSFMALVLVTPGVCKFHCFDRTFIARRRVWCSARRGKMVSSSVW